MLLRRVSTRRHMTVPLRIRSQTHGRRSSAQPRWGVRVTPAIPILFFGDIEGYRASPFRVATVGLNPSLTEFPPHDPFCRFPLAADVGPGDQGRYLAALSAYFRTAPYMSWFASFEPLLNGANTSYYPGETSTALHTDICSPVATDPTWSGLSNAERAALETGGGPLWHQLLEVLRPALVVLSVAKRHLNRIRFEATDDRQVVHTIAHKVDGTRRARPYCIVGRWHQFGKEPSLFIYGPAATKTLTNRQRPETRSRSDHIGHIPTRPLAMLQATEFEATWGVVGDRPIQLRPSLVELRREHRGRDHRRRASKAALLRKGQGASVGSRRPKIRPQPYGPASPRPTHPRQPKTRHPPPPTTQHRTAAKWPATPRRPNPY